MPKPLPSPDGGTRPGPFERDQSDAGAAPSACVDDAPVPHQKSTREMPIDRGSRVAARGTVDLRVSRFAYSRWDGTQVGFDLDADALLEEMTDDLLYHGDLNAALRRMMQQGFTDREGRDVQGMREMLEKLREQRREQLDRYDLGGVYEDIANRLDEIVDEERDGIDRRLDDARAVRRQAPRGTARRARAANGASSSSSCRPTSRAASATCSSTTGWTTPRASSSKS